MKTKAMHMHPHAVIWDLERSVCHLQIKHKGSISHKYLYSATLILFAVIFPFLQCELISAKKAKLRELVGEVEEDELEGEAVVGPSWEATTHSSGSTPLFYFVWILHRNIIQNFCLFSLTYPSPLFPSVRWFCWGGSSQIANQGREDIDTLCSWVQVGGFPAWPEEEAQGLSIEVNLFYLPFL